MITWEHSEWFVALLGVPVLVLFFAWVLARHRRMARIFASEAVLKEIRNDRARGRRMVQAVCYVLAYVFAILALAGPKWGYHWQEVHREGIDLFIALDLSKSMLAEDVKPNRLERAKKEVEDLLEVLPTDRIGIIAFAGSAFVVCPLTLDHEVARMFLDDLRVGQIEHGSDVGAAINKALKSFGNTKGENRAIILITDGEDNENRALAMAKKAKEAGVKIFTIGIGTSTGAPVPVTDEEGHRNFLKDKQGKTVVSKLGGEGLQKIALDTGGAYLQLSGGAFQLASFYKSQISKIQKKELGETRKKVYENRFQWPLSIALLLVLAGFMMEDRWVLPRLRFRSKKEGKKNVPSAV